MFQAKARLAEATSKRLEAENNLEIAISEYIAVVGREPNINWKKKNKEKITSNNPIDWSKFGKIPNLRERHFEHGLQQQEYNNVILENKKKKKHLKSYQYFCRESKRT